MNSHLKFLAVALVFVIAPSAFAKLLTGTLVVVYLSQQKAVVAEDSLMGIGEPPYSVRKYDCKLTTLGDHMVFAGTGALGIQEEWTLRTEAERVYGSSGSSLVPEIASAWATSVASRDAVVLKRRGSVKWISGPSCR